MAEDRRESVVTATKKCEALVEKWGVEKVMDADYEYDKNRIKSEYDFKWHTSNNQSRNREQADVIRDFDYEFGHAKSIYKIAEKDPALAKQIYNDILALSKSSNKADQRAADMLATYFLRDHQHEIFPNPTSFYRDIKPYNLKANGKDITQAERVFLINDGDFTPYHADRFKAAGKVLDEVIANSHTATQTIGKLGKPVDLESQDMQPVDHSQTR